LEHVHTHKKKIQGRSILWRPALGKLFCM